MGSFSRLQEMFSTQGSNPGLPLYKKILYQLNHKGRPRILEWVEPIPSPAELPTAEPWSPELQADSLPMSYEGSHVTSEIQIPGSCHQFMLLSTSALEFTFLTH